MGEPGLGKGEMTNRWGKYDEAKLDDLRNHKESKTSFILRYTLTHPNSNTNIVGTSNINHLLENIESVQRGPIPMNIYAEVRRRLTNVGMLPVKVT
jgi:aryl-alcohol dehydrogenase-like predicted oxidoreductase